jgi:IclR family transcriptional regulator, acetate operon repressor
LRLAAAPAELLDRISRKMRLTAMTPRTITSWEKLDEELAAIRARGFAYDEEENSIGISAVSVAMTEPGGGFVALSMPVPTPRFEQERERCVEILLEGSRKLAKILSGN